MKKDEIYGGKIILLGGDFRQKANVIMRGSRCDLQERFIKNSKLWKNVEIFKLEKNIRSIDQNQLLMNIGNGNIKRWKIPSENQIKTNIIDEIFADNFITDTLHENTILTVDNNDAYEINKKILEKIEGEEHVYLVPIQS